MAAGDDSLRATGLKVHFEGVRAVDGVDLTLERDEILGLIGPNGAGKTTMLNALSGFAKLTAGRIHIGGTDVTRRSPYRRARLGLARTFQNVRLFSDLSAFENVEAAAVTTGMRRREARKWTVDILERMGLAERADAPAASLPYGDERILGIARALATRPRFLLLDEPAAGLNEVESEALATTLRGIRDGFDCGLLVIEHDMGMIMSLCDRIQVLEYGKTICTGTPDEVKRDPAVVAAYLGTEEVTSAQA